jgi:hypothetical protein
MTTDADATRSRTARLAGTLYLLMMPLGVLGIVYIPARLVVRNDATATAERITASESLFRSGIVSHLLSQVVFVFLVFTLFRLLEGVNGRHARIMVILALVGVPMAMLSELGHLAALVVLDSPAGGSFTTAQLHAQAMWFIDLRAQAILIAQIFWGLWLLPLGALVYQSGFLPRPIGVLLAIAGAGYFVDSMTQLLTPGFPVVSLFTFVGELALALWLVIKGAGTGQRPAVVTQE